MNHTAVLNSLVSGVPISVAPPPLVGASLTILLTSVMLRDMYNPLKDRIGQKFGKLLVVSRAPNKGEVTICNCKCDCGLMTTVRAGDLQSGNTKSCGCLVTETNTKHGHGRRGKNRTPEYCAWDSMLQRCYNKKHPNFKYYGARGIKVYPTWRQDFTAFLKSMGPRPAANYTLERINNDGNYEPSNCKWATWLQQANNKRKGNQFNHLEW